MSVILTALFNNFRTKRFLDSLSLINSEDRLLFFVLEDILMNQIIDKIYEIDHSILLFIQENCRFEFLTPIMQFSSVLVNAGLLWIILCFILICFKKTRVMGLVALSSLAFCFLITNVLLKNLIARARPFDNYNDLVPLIKKPTDFSFPSGHTTASFATVGVLVRFLNKPLIAVTVIYAFLVAFSRLYLGVHYPSDVLCGMLIGICGSCLIYFLYSKKFDLKKYKLSRHEE